MNVLARTIIVLFAVANLVVASTLKAQNSDEGVQRAVAAKEAEVAQRQAEAAQKQMEAARRQIELATVVAETRPTMEVVPVPPAAPGEKPVSVSVPSISFKGAWPSRAGAGSVLVIPAAELKMEDLATMTEDMSVMSRIFEKNLEQADIATSRGGLFLSSRDPFSVLLGGGGAIQSMYLEGYGALFLMKVDFPLSPPPQVEEEVETQREQEGDPVWEQMRRQMYEPQEAAVRRAEQPEQKYAAEKVENLKTTLVKSLKHAANIRNLKPDELVILAIAGSGVSASDTAMVTTMSAVVVDGHRKIVQQQPGLGGSSQTVLVIRAKRSDVDDFAKGDLSYDQFRQRSKVFTCAWLSGEAGHGHPFNFSRTRR